MTFQEVWKFIKGLTTGPIEVKLNSMPALKGLYLRMVEAGQDKDKQLNSLKRAYIGAFGIIAILSIFGHAVTLHITNNQKENAELSFAITSIRALVDVIVSQATVFKNSTNSLDDELLTKSLATLKREYAQIGIYDDAKTNVFQDPRYHLDRRLSQFIRTADDFVKYHRLGKRNEAAISFSTLSGELSNILDINLDLALQQYRKDTMREIDRDYSLQFIGLVIILVVLGLEAKFIFSPLVRHLHEYHKHLIKLALTDMLTGLNNRRAFMQLAVAGLDHFNRHKKPFVLVLMDLDHFKNINDTYGHKVGDLVLQHYSALMQKTLRAHDTLGRIGGEEFAMFLPQIAPEEARALLERCRKAVAETPCPYTDANGEEKTLTYTSSFGAVAVSDGNWTLDQLFIRADEQLYKAKQRGRNIIILEGISQATEAASAAPETPAAAPPAT